MFEIFISYWMIWYFISCANDENLIFPFYLRNISYNILTLQKRNLGWIYLLLIVEN